ncbi:hypothetical protein GCM10009753_38580 [Streptantibioticus ferralitis]
MRRVGGEVVHALKSGILHRQWGFFSHPSTPTPHVVRCAAGRGHHDPQGVRFLLALYPLGFVSPPTQLQAQELT